MSEKYHVRIRNIEKVAENIRHLTLEKPESFSFTPGQAVLFHLPKSGSDEEPSPFSPVSLPGEGELEFYIKIYPKRDGLTDALDDYDEGDEIEIGEAFGDIHYRGRGTFLAAGTGITPMLAMLRHLHANDDTEGNILYYAESTKKELIAPSLLSEILGENANFILSDEGDSPQRIDRTFLEKKIVNFGNQKFYVCGPPEFQSSCLDFLRQKGVSEDELIYEGMNSD